MVYSIESIAEEYHPVIDSCYTELKELLVSSGISNSVRRETTKTEKAVIFIIELIALHKEDDDYGIVIDVQIKNKEEEIFCEIDILKATGQLYSENSFSVYQKGEIREKNLDKSKEFISNLPQAVAETFIKDYR